MHDTLLKPLLASYLDWQRSRNYSSGTVRNTNLYITNLLNWLEERSITHASQVTRLMLERYQRHLFHYRKADGQPLTFANQHVQLSTIRTFFKWLCRQNHLPANPASEMELPKVEKRLPPSLLSAHEVETILNVPDIHTAIGIRDRALLETLYSSGIRRKELTNLTLYDLDLQQQTLMVRQGKGKKDRLLPLTDRASEWLHKYLSDIRPQLLIEPDDHKSLFLSHTGKPLSPGVLGNLVRKHIQAAGIEKKGSCHLFRHAVATLMMDNGADLRSIQQLLGHENLNTTELYTHLSIQKLQQVHRNTHPAQQTRQNSDSKSKPT